MSSATTARVIVGAAVATIASVLLLAPRAAAAIGELVAAAQTSSASWVLAVRESSGRRI